MAIKASEVIDKTLKLLQDADGLRFPAETELLPWLNDGLREAIGIKPQLGVTTVNEALVAGSRQMISGAAVEKFAYFIPVSLAFLNRALPGWQNAAADAAVKFVAYDPNEPKIFWVYPPQPVATTAHLLVSQVMQPALLAALTDDIPFNDLDVPALIDYLCYRSYAKEMDQVSLVRSDAYYNAFAGKLGVKPKVAVPQAQWQPAAEQAAAQ